ncbi:MAG TPA: quinone-dependent dihydroorotate dehydrogenase [Chloroflexota bacterium]|nr:quinone-dependent dihydroorotate dehydrogenase [Chloroflexota bacterium]
MGRLDPERAHDLTLRLLGLAQRAPGALALLERLFAVREPRLAVRVAGLTFPNPVGLAAGLDKDARAPAAFAALGLGAVEVGTVTPRGQAGNPRPRIFRLPAEGALINRMGFPNRGAAAVRASLLGHLPRAAGRAGGGPGRPPLSLPGNALLGINLGKNAATPLPDAPADYLAVLEALADLAAYAVVNVSSPNTQGLRDLQERRALEALLGAVVQRRDSLARRHGRRLPLLVKVSPDLDWAGLGAVLEAVGATGVEGIVATNTTLARGGLSDPRRAEAGGLSGGPLRQRSTEVVRWLARETGGRLPLVAVGGIARPEQALEKLDAGASLVQLYTGLIYAGPSLPARICRALLARRP